MALVRGEAAEIFGKTISVKLLKMLVSNAANQMSFRSDVLLMEGPVLLECEWVVLGAIS